jgi:hypothetical protein
MKKVIALVRLTRNFLQVRERWRKGGQGIAPLRLHPPPGREGVPLIAFFLNTLGRIDLYKRFRVF